MARKLYQNGYKVVRINMRGCGTGKGHSKLPYCAGNSQDMLKAIQYLKKISPASDIILIGFSLGANIALKLGGELGKDAIGLIKSIIAICPPLDLSESIKLIQEYPLYHHYYLRMILKQELPVFKKKTVHSIYELDDVITGPSWGFSGAQEYYEKCSAKQFLPDIAVETHILLAEDDPFVSMDVLDGLSPSNQIYFYSTQHGGHMGFLGHPAEPRSWFWLDNLLLNWIEGQKDRTPPL